MRGKKVDENITLSGIVYEIIYQNEVNGYTVCEIDSSINGLVTATGYMPYLSEGEKISVTGSWTIHPDYGEQFQVSTYETILPTDEDSIYDYLSSGVIYGIKEATAKKIVEHFGCDSLSVMLTDPVRLSEIKGISKARAEKIGKSYLEVQSMQSIILFCRQYNLSTNLAVKIHRALGSDAVKIVNENPYILAESIEGISFKTSDTIALLRGCAKNSPLRIRSGIKSILLSSAYNFGHTYLPVSVLIEETAKHLEIEKEDILSVLEALNISGEIYLDKILGEEVCYLKGFFESERYVTSRIASLSSHIPDCNLTDDEINNVISNVENEENILLDEIQKKAVYESAKNGAIVITGGPGTGKTTTINTIIQVLSSMNLSIALAAPTGRAAKRMSQITGLEAKTIHRLLCVQPSEDDMSVRFTHNESNPLPFDVIILDEVSMVDIQLMNSFLRAVKKGARIIFSGDSDQLPSVGPGNVLRDICESGILPIIRLKHIFRQAQESLIVMNAHKINDGIMPEIAIRDNDFFFMKRSSTESVATTICDLFRNRLPNSYKINPVSSIQVLCPSKKGVAGSINLNRMLQDYINPYNITKQEYSYGKTVFRVGDKVMQVKNNYDLPWYKDTGEKGTGIFNGDMGIIESISLKDRQINIIFDDDKHTDYSLYDLENLDLAYAITVHKSQGSEFPFIIIPICRFAPMLMCRNLLYTAVTRAKNMVIMVGNSYSLEMMVSNNEEKKRYSGLCERLKQLQNFSFEEHLDEMQKNI